jgi:hypothetical protein
VDVPAGGFDGAIDKLYGGLGADTFIRHARRAEWIFAEPDNNVDFSAEDRVVLRMH